MKRALRGLRWRIFWVFVALGAGASLTWVFRTEIFGYLLAPAGEELSITGKPVFTGPTEMFSLTIGMAVKGGVIAALPMLAFQIYAAIRPLLSRRHRRILCFFLWLAVVFYVAGTAFAYFVILPNGLRFLLQFGTNIATPMIRITEYMALALALLFWVGLSFQIPIVMLLLARLSIATHTQFKRLRRYTPIAALILGMIITPTPDFINQLFVAGPLVALYEVGIFLAWLARPVPRGEGSTLNPVRWPLIRNVWTLVWATLLVIFYVQLTGIFTAVAHVFRVAFRGRVTVEEQVSLHERVKLRVNGYLRFLKRMGVVVECRRFSGPC